MQRKLKSVFSRSSKSRGSLEEPESSTHYAEANSPRSERHRVSSDRHGRTSVDSSVTDSAYTSQSRPVSSAYDDRHQSQAPAKQMLANNLVSSSDSNGGAIANDYKAYLPALSAVNDDYVEEHISVRDRVTGRSEARHEEDVANPNTARYGTSIDSVDRGIAGVAHNEPVEITSNAPILNPTSGQQQSCKQSAGGGSIGSTLGSARTGGSVEEHAIRNGNDINASFDNIRSHTETGSHEKDSQGRTGIPPHAARAEPEWERRNPHISDSENDVSRSPRRTHKVQGAQSGVRHATVDGTAHGEEVELARQLREDGIVDLRNTIDTDGDVTWAPAVTHEVIKPHQHEIIQQKIYREVHNYEYFHRIQPVMVTEVLPPRHWIPNPKGEGLIEISADELPARTGENRWWSICEHSSPYALQKTPHKYRTEPEIIEAGTVMTEGGFERKETIIIHPPTLADLNGYTGPVQTVHFDHKTGERWVGELTTMDRLHKLQQTLDRAPDARAFQMDGLSESLPNVPSNSMPLRKPVSGQSSTVHESNVGHQVAA